MYEFFFAGTPFKIASWDFFFFLGIAVIAVLGFTPNPRNKDFPLTKLEITACAFIMIFAGLMGAKLQYLLLHWQAVSRQGYTLPQDITAAGYGYVGGVIAILIAVFIFVKFRKKSFLAVADGFMPLLILLGVFIRMGCFASGCCYGKLTNVPWATLTRQAPGLRHPTQLYSIIFLLVIFFVMLKVYDIKDRPAGVVLFGSLFLYGFFRFFVEFFRVDSTPVLGVITLAQVAMVLLAAISGGVIIVLLSRYKKA